MATYVPGTGETDPKKLIWSLQQIGPKLDGAIGDIATNSTNIATNTAAIAALQAAKPAFSAGKGGTNQTGIADATFTQVTWSTEDYDIGSHFASNAWTPPAGLVSLTAVLLISGTFTTGNQTAVAIFKNGSPFRQANSPASSVYSGGGPQITVEDRANGTDSYTVQVYADVNSGTVTVSGNQNTFFCGHWISA